MADRRRRDVPTEFPGNLVLQQEVEDVLRTAFGPPEPFDNSQALNQLSTDGVERTAYRETSHSLLANSKAPQTGDVQYKKHSTGGLGSDLSLKRSSPWDSYAKDYRRDLGGSVLIVYKRQATSQLFAMKDIPDVETGLTVQVLRKVRHENLVWPHEVFEYNSTAYIIFEYMAVSLDNINSSALHPNELQVSTIIYQVLNGIAFLASEGMIHGNITCSNVLISREGEVKIANPQECIDISSSKGRNVIEDTEALGHVMHQLMERGGIHSRLPPLKEPSHWSKEAREFLELTTSASIQQLLSHAFLRGSPRKEELVRLVDCAMLTSRIKFCLESS